MHGGLYIQLLVVGILYFVVPSGICYFISTLGRELAWNYLKKNWETYKTKFQGGFMLSRTIEV